MTTVMQMKQQILHNKVKQMKMTVRVTMKARIMTIVVMTTTTMTTAVAASSMKATMMITAKKCK